VTDGAGLITTLAGVYCSGREDLPSATKKVGSGNRKRYFNSNCTDQKAARRIGSYQYVLRALRERAPSTRPRVTPRLCLQRMWYEDATRNSNACG